jgi:hypothetical protein
VLKSCIDEHPILSTVILHGDTERPVIATPRTLDLDAHLEIREADHDISEDKSIEKLLTEVSDEPFSSLHITPPWKVVLVSLSSAATSGRSRLLVLYSNYHSHGDGRSGLGFHSSFHAELVTFLGQTIQQHKYIEPICKASAKPLLPPIEEGGTLSLSW